MLYQFLVWILGMPIVEIILAGLNSIGGYCPTIINCGRGVGSSFIS